MMNNKLQKLFNIVLCILLVLCLMQMNTMNQELKSLRNTMNNQYNSIQNSVNAISSNVRNQMEEANNLLTDSGWSTGGLNIEDKTAILSCYVVPKEYSPKGTVAELICNDKAVPMQLVNGKYVAEITLPLFEDMQISTVQFTENGAIRTQQLNWHISPRYDMVPSVYMYHSGGNGYTYRGENITKYYDGYLEIDVVHNGLAKNLKEAEIVTLLNGVETMRSTPKLEEINSNEDTAHYRTEFNQTLEVKAGDTVEMYMTVKDENGWIYRGILEDVEVGQDGNHKYTHDGFPAEADIYDADGNLLFEGYKN